MKNIILGIIPQIKNPPYLFSDYVITIDLHYNIFSLQTAKMDMVAACNTAIIIAQVLEALGEYNVRFSTLSEDRACTEYIALYRKKNGTCPGKQVP